MSNGGREGGREGGRGRGGRGGGREGIKKEEHILFSIQLTFALYCK